MIDYSGSATRFLKPLIIYLLKEYTHEKSFLIALIPVFVPDCV